MPFINSKDIALVNIPLQQGFDIGTLVTDLTLNQKKDNNVTKAKINWIKKDIIGRALEFHKIIKKNDSNIYHHVGIYSFRYETLKKFISLPTSICSNDVLSIKAY